MGFTKADLKEMTVKVSSIKEISDHLTKLEKKNKDKDGWMGMPDKLLINYALNLWANYIETGNVITSAKDVQAMHKPVKALDLDAMKLVVRLREMADSIL